MQRKLPEQDIAQGSYIALPLTLLILLAGYNHDKVGGPETSWAADVSEGGIPHDWGVAVEERPLLQRLQHFRSCPIPKASLQGHKPLVTALLTLKPGVLLGFW